MCDSYVEESIPHFLLQCRGLERQRVPLLAGIRTAMPPAMVNNLDCMTAVKQTEFLLGEMGRTFITEWSGIHIGIIELVHVLYRAREAIYTAGQLCKVNTTIPCESVSLDTDFLHSCVIWGGEVQYNYMVH